MDDIQRALDPKSMYFCKKIDLPFGDCIIEGKEDGISIIPDPERFKAVVGAREL